MMDQGCEALGRTQTWPAGRARAKWPAARQDWDELRVLIIDTETTGVDVENDRVVELGAVYYERRQCGNGRRMRINPGCPIPPDASAIHGIHDEHVRHKPTFATVAPRFLAHVSGSALSGPAPRLCGYNAAGFDVPLLNAELRRAGMDDRIAGDQVLDLMIFARWHHRNLRSRSLMNLCQHYGIPLHNAHSALADATATGLLLRCLIEAGLLPDTFDEALAQQTQLQQKMRQEWQRWNYWLYEDRNNGQLRLGAGRHCGDFLSEVDPLYLISLLERIADLPEEVRAILRTHTMC